MKQSEQALQTKTAKFDKLQSNLTKRSAKYKQLEKDHMEMQDKLETLQVEHRDLNTKFQNTCDRQMVYKQEISSLKTVCNELPDCKAIIAALKLENMALIDRVTALQTQYREDMGAFTASYTAQIQEREEQLQQTNEQLIRTKDEQIELWKSRYDEGERHKADISTEYISLQKDAAELVESNESMEKELAAKEEKVLELQQLIEREELHHKEALKEACYMVICCHFTCF